MYRAQPNRSTREHDERMHRTLAEISTEAFRFSYPLFGLDDRDCPDLYASCVMLECDNIAVLVTAAHAIDAIGNDTKTGVHVGAKIITQVPNRFERDNLLDIAAVALPQEFLRNQGIDALPLNRTTAGRAFSNADFRCVHGYPCSKNKQAKRTDHVKTTFTRYHFTYAGISPNSVNYKRFNKDPGLHVALNYRKGTNEKGNREKPPHPCGMSGGGLWLVSANNVFLDGIAIEYHQRESLVFSTRVERVVNFIQSRVLHKS